MIGIDKIHYQTDIFLHTPPVIDSSTRQISKEIDLSKAINKLFLNDKGRILSPTEYIFFSNIHEIFET